MHTFYTRLSTEVEEQLKFIHAEFEQPQQWAEEAYVLTEKAYRKLQDFVLKYKFKSQSDEIQYFKRLKPTLSAKLIYYSQVYHIENKKPQGSYKKKRKYLLRELNKINGYFEANVDFIKYYRSNESYLDHIYFIRNKTDFKMLPGPLLTELDKKQCTAFDYKVAKIIANDQLQLYLYSELRTLDTEASTEIIQTPNISLEWKASKVALTELIYALHASGAFDSNKTDINQLVKFCEQVFNIELGDVYRTFLELRMRKNGRTKFVDSLRENLIRRMDEQDGK